MKKLIRYFTFILIAPVAIIILAAVILSFLYSPRYVYRLVKYNVADVYDYKHFENRVIRTADNTFSFPDNSDESFVESLFLEKVKASGLQSYNEWAENSLTTALIVIRREETIIVHCGNSLEFYNSDVLWTVSEIIR